MKLSTRDTKLLLMLAGLVVFLLSYLLVYNRFTEMQNELTAQITELQPQLATLEEYHAKQPEYEEAIRQYEETIAQEMSKYPSEVRTEDLTLYAKDLEPRIGIDVTGLIFSAPLLISEFEGILPQEDGQVDALMRGYQSNMSMSGTMTYTQLKNLLDHIYRTYEYTSAESVSVSYNAELENLIGTVEIGKFYLTYPDAPPVTNDMPYVPKGNENLFGGVQ